MGTAASTLIQVQAFPPAAATTAPSTRDMPTDELLLALTQAPHLRVESELNRYRDRRACAGTRTTPTPTLGRISPHDFLDLRHESKSPSLPSRPATAQGDRTRSVNRPVSAKFASYP